MIKISQQQISERWDILSISLREVLYSPEYGKTIWKIGVEHHLDDRKIGIIVGIAGYIIYGFLHPDDLTREIQESLNLNPQIANSISREINRKIFASIRMDLEKIYSPVSAMPEIKPPTKPFDETQGKPEPEIKIEKEVELKPAPFPIAPTTSTIPTPVVPTTPVPAEKPFILQQETEPKPVGEKKRVAPPIIGWFRKEKPPKTETPIKVELETPGLKTEEKKEPIIAKTEAPKQKVIHYREVEMPTPFGEPGTQPPKETEPPKPEEPKVISLDSFEVVKEKEGN